MHLFFAAIVGLGKHSASDITFFCVVLKEKYLLFLP